jgi:hypothetical protein
MDLNVAWLMEPAQTLRMAEFEAWYLGAHTEIAKQMPGLLRYSLARLVEDGIVEAPEWLGQVHRVAQLVWPGVAAAEAAFTSPAGLASFGDNLLNTGSSAYTRAVGLTTDRSLSVAVPVVHDVVTGRFRRRPDHGGDPLEQVDDATIVRVYGYGFSPDGSAPAPAANDSLWTAVRRDPRVRALVLGRSAERPLQLGRIEVPGADTPLARWSMECWFDSVSEAREVLAGAPFLDAWRQVSSGVSSTYLGIFAAQEIHSSRPAT